MSNFVYELIDPTNEKVFYIGITNNPKNRLGQHCQLSNRNWKINPRKTQVISNLKKSNKKPIMNILFEQLSLEEAIEVEAQLIEYMSVLGYSLTNISEGGKGGHYVRTPEIRDKIRKALQGRKLPESRRLKSIKYLIPKFGKDNPMFGKIGAMKNKSHSAESKRKMSISKIGIDSLLKLEDYQYMFHQYIENKKSTRVIGKELSVSKHCVFLYLKIHKISLRKPYRPTH